MPDEQRFGFTHQPKTCRGEHARFGGPSIAVFLVMLGLAACGDPSSGSRGTGALAGSDTSYGRVATFATRAAAAGGLIDPTGGFADYQRVVGPEAGTWQVFFTTSECLVTPTSEGCEPGDDLIVEVELRRDRLGVREVRGPVTAEERGRVLAYEEPATPESPRFVFTDVVIADGVDEGLQLRTTAVWTGPIPASPALTFACHVELLSEDGVILYRGPEIELSPPPSEDQRSGAIYSFGTPVIDADAAQRAERGEVVCV